jgi:hypothetical protein
MRLSIISILIFILLISQFNIAQDNTNFGIFYSIWHCPESKEYNPNITQYELAKIFNGTQDLGPVGAWHWVYKPVNGYYCLSKNEEVLKKHANMLRDAGIEFVMVDMTNHPYKNDPNVLSEARIQEPFEKLLEVWSKIDGAPKIVPWVPIPKNEYSQGDNDMINYAMNIMINDSRYYNMWFNYKNKRLILAVDYSGIPTAPWAEASQERISAIEGSLFGNSFIVRTMWVDAMTPNIQWSYFSRCQSGFLNSGGTINCNQRKFYNGTNLEHISVVSAYQDMWAGSSIISDTATAIPRFGGKTFRKQFETVLKNPSVDIVTIVGWNELLNIRGCFNSQGVYTLDPNSCITYYINGNAGFHDNYTIEYSKDIEPIADYGKYEESWYYYNLMKGCISLYKSGETCTNQPNNICCRSFEAADSLRPNEICGNEKDDDYDDLVDEGCVINCVESDWSHSSGTCQSNNTLIVTNTLNNQNCSGGVQYQPTTTQTCTYQAPTCTAFTYNSWTPTTCPQSATQTRTIKTQTPSGCQGGNPQLTQACTYTPTCTAANWTPTETACQSNNQKTITWTKIGTCSGGVTHTSPEIVSCEYQAPTCTAFTYNAWTPTTCSQSATQTRTIKTQTPTGCQGGTPTLTQTCTYTPTCTDTDWTPTETTCQQDNTKTITWQKTTNCQNGIQKPNTQTLTCNYQAPTCQETDFEYSEWSQCSQQGTQTRTYTKTNNNCEGNPQETLTRNCTYTPTCTDSHWDFTITPSTCPQSGTQTKEYFKIANCENGIQKTNTTINCTYNAPTCEYNYTEYGECINGIKTRTATLKGETNCQGQAINLSKSCKITPTCTESNWSFTLSPCENGEQTKTWEKISECENGVLKQQTETINCIDNSEIPDYCGSNDWESRVEPEICPQTGIQTRYWTKTNTNCQAGLTKKSQETIKCTPQTNNQNNNTQNNIQSNEDTPINNNQDDSQTTSPNNNTTTNNETTNDNQENLEENNTENYPPTTFDLIAELIQMILNALGLN